MLKLKLLHISARRRYFLFLIGTIVPLAFLLWSKKQKVLETSNGLLIDDLPVHDCGVVLTGAAGRIREAFEILAEKKINRLIISGVYRNTQLHEIFPQLPYYPEVNPQDIVLEKISGSTRENATESLVLVREMGCKSVLLITSDLHMYRARRLFQDTYPADIQLSHHSVPSIKSLVDIYYEALKVIWYDTQSLLF